LSIEVSSKIINYFHKIIGGIMQHNLDTELDLLLCENDEIYFDDLNSVTQLELMHKLLEEDDAFIHDYMIEEGDATNILIEIKKEILGVRDNLEECKEIYEKALRHVTRDYCDKYFEDNRDRFSLSDEELNLVNFENED
jgi:chemotaxis methyl-accepting protein methylase